MEFVRTVLRATVLKLDTDMIVVMIRKERSDST